MALPRHDNLETFDSVRIARNLDERIDIKLDIHNHSFILRQVYWNVTRERVSAFVTGYPVQPYAHYETRINIEGTMEIEPPELMSVYPDTWGMYDATGIITVTTKNAYYKIEGVVITSWETIGNEQVSNSFIAQRVVPGKHSVYHHRNSNV